MSRFFAIMGTGRSGTQYMSYLFKRLGYDVNHQACGKDGISSFAVVGEGMVAGKRHGHSVGGHQVTDFILAVRDPWKVLASNLRVKGPPCRTIAEYLNMKDENIVERYMKCIVKWNQMAEELKPKLVVKVEEADKVIQEWLGQSLRVAPPPKDVNKRHQYEPLTAEEIHSVSDETLEAFKAHCRKYGYDDTPPCE